MNWSRVKTIAILVFVLIFVFLVIRYLNLFPKEEYLTKQQVDIAKSILLQNSIKLLCDVDRRIYYVSKLSVTTENKYDSIVTKLFGKRVDRYQNEFESSIYHLKIVNQYPFFRVKVLPRPI